MQMLSNKPIPLRELNARYAEVNGFSVEGPWHKQFIRIFKLTDKFNHHVARRYDGMSGGHYLECVLGLYIEGIISEEEISTPSDEPRAFLMNYKKMVDEEHL